MPSKKLYVTGSRARARCVSLLTRMEHEFAATESTSEGTSRGDQAALLAEFEGAVRGVVAAAPHETRTAAEALNTVLIKIAKVPAAERHALAQPVLAALDEPKVKAAVDARGASSRALAVVALLEWGYPWALHLHPDDLAFFRKRGRRSARRWWLAGASLVALAVGAVAYFERPPEIYPDLVTLEQTHFSYDPQGVVVRVPSPSGLRTARVPFEPGAPEVERAARAYENGEYDRGLSELEGCATRGLNSCLKMALVGYELRAGPMDEAAARGVWLKLRELKDPALNEFASFLRPE